MIRALDLLPRDGGCVIFQVVAKGVGGNMLALTKAFLVVLGVLTQHAPAMAQRPDEMASLPVGELRALAERGNMNAQLTLGVRYANGDGVARDGAEAVRWLRMAADKGDLSAQYNLGVMYDDGEGVPESDAEAVRWYRLAADQGYADAQSKLGFMYADGLGVPENDAEAVRWFRMAADQGLGSAQHNLGFMYANGEGVPKNDVEAYKWFNLAAAQGDALARDQRDAVAEFMTPAQIAEAQRLSAQWRPKPAN